MSTKLFSQISISITKNFTIKIIIYISNLKNSKSKQSKS